MKQNRIWMQDYSSNKENNRVDYTEEYEKKNNNNFAY